MATKPTFFSDPSAFRAWLKAHHARATELLVGFHRTTSGRASITWPQAVDEALCFGWIDGVRHRIDDASYTIRFTPRRPDSLWSAVNIRRVAALQAAGRMQRAGLAAFAARSERKSRTYSYEQASEAVLAPPHEKELRAHKRAWAFFQAQAPSYRRKVAHWVNAAKQEETRGKRIRKLIELFAQGRKA